MSRDRRDRRERYTNDRYRDDRRAREKKKKRKHSKHERSCCSSCLISIVILLVVTVGLLYGGGTFAWNQYAKPMFGISFNDALALVGSTYIAKEKDIVTNPYAEEDVDGFYNALSDALFLDDSVDLKASLADVLDDFVGKMVGGSSNSAESTGTVSAADESESGSSSSASTFTTGNEALDNFLKALKFDFSSLKDYEDEYATPKVLEITDKQTAAFLNDTIKTATSIDAIKGKLPEFAKNVDLGSIVEIPQVVVTSDSALSLEDVALTLTVKVNLRKTVKDVASSYHEALGYVSYLLPKALYATITIYPNSYIREAQIRVNSFSDKKMGDAYSIANYFLKNTQYGSIDGILKMVNQKAIEAIEKVQDIVPVNFIATGSVQAHPIQALMKMLGATDVTETQFYCMIRDLCLPTFLDVKETIGLGYVNIPEDTPKDQINDAIDEVINELVLSGKQALIEEMNLKYGLEEGYLKPDTMLSELQGVGGDNSELIKHVSIERLDYTDTTLDNDKQKVDLEYTSLSGLLDGYLNGATSSSEEGSGSGLNMNYKLLNSKYSEATNTLSLVIQLGVLDVITGSMSDGSILKSFIGQLIPKYIYIQADVCLDPDSTAATMEINNSNAEETIELLNTIGALTSGMGASLGLNYTEITTSVAQKVRDGINDINKKLGNETEGIVAITFTNEKAELLSIYDIMSYKILYKAEETNLTPAEMYLVFKDTSVVQDEYKGVDKSENLENFTARVNSRYATTSAYTITDTSADEEPDPENTIVKQLKRAGENYDKAFDGSTLALSWIEQSEPLGTPLTDSEKLELMHTNFSPYSTEPESAKIFDGAFTITAEGVENITLNKVRVLNQDELRLIYTCDYKLNEGDGAKYASVLPHFVINVVFDITKVDSDLEPGDPGYEDCCIVQINDMTDPDVIADFTLMCTRLGVNNFNLTSIQEKTNTSVRSGLKDTFRKVDISIDVDRKSVYYGSLFDIVYKNKKDNYNDTVDPMIEYKGIDDQIIDVDGGTASALDVANMMAAINKAPTSYGQKDITKQLDAETFAESTYYRYNKATTNYIEQLVYDPQYAYYIKIGATDNYFEVTDKFDANRDATNVISSTTGTISASLTARNLGESILSKDTTALKSSIGMKADAELDLYQVMMLDFADSTYDDENGDIQTSLSNLLSGSGKHIVSTFEIATSGFNYESTLLPAHLYLTAAVDTSTGAVTVLYNNLSARDLAVLRALSGKNANSFNTTNVASSMQTHLYGVTLLSIDARSVTIGDVIGQPGAGTIVENKNGGKIQGNYNIAYTYSIV